MSLTKHNTVKTYLVHHAVKTYRRSGGIAPLILNLDTKWMWLSDLCSSRFTPEVGGKVGPRAGLKAMAKRKGPIIGYAGNWTPFAQPGA